MSDYNNGKEEGQKAFQSGIAFNQNPYLYDSVGANTAGWNTGWLNEQQAQKKKALERRNINRLKYR